MPKSYKVGDMILCPACGLEIPLVAHPNGTTLVAYHNCTGVARRAVFSAPLSKPRQPKPAPQETTPEVTSEEGAE